MNENMYTTVVNNTNGKKKTRGSKAINDIVPGNVITNRRSPSNTKIVLLKTLLSFILFIYLVNNG